jgi:hypothetical protein
MTAPVKRASVRYRKKGLRGRSLADLPMPKNIQDQLT